MPEKEYRRLTGARMRRKGIISAVMTRSSLWLGKDHLLSIDTTGYVEEYKRFYFRDIQAVVVRRTIRWRVLTIILSIPAIILTIFLLTASEPASQVALGIMAAIFYVPLIVNFILGPTCQSHLRTAVQIEELPSLSRLRRARKVLNRIRPFIGEAQGLIAPEEIPARMRDLTMAVAAAAPVSQSALPDDPNAPPRMAP